jgi:hypothetical protein
MRSIALDVHRDFCEIAIKDESGLRRAGRVKTSQEELELFAQSLAPDDQLALEATGPAQAIARILEPHVGRVVIANTRKLRAIAESKVKTDKLDASTPRPSDSCPTSVWIPAFASPAKRPLGMDTSQSRARPRHATCSARQPGCSSGPPARCAPSMSVCARAGGHKSRSSRPPES